MAGGIFVNQPYHPNAKCIAISAIVAAAYWYVPRDRNPFTLLFLFIFSYVGIALYDYLYSCDTQLYTGTSFGPGTFDSIFKSQRAVSGETTTPKQEALVADPQKLFDKNVILFHLIAVVPLLLYLGWYGTASLSQAYGPTLILGVLATVYFIVRWFVPRTNMCPSQ